MDVNALRAGPPVERKALSIRESEGEDHRRGGRWMSRS